MKAKFEVDFLEPAVEFLEKLGEKARNKVIYNIDKARYVNDPKLFKKLDNEIWEFRTKFAGKQHRMLAFWVKSKHNKTLVIATHGFVKKVSKVPKAEIKRAKTLKKDYLNE